MIGKNFKIIVEQDEQGYYLVAYRINSSGTQSAFCNDNLMCDLVGLKIKEYQKVLIDNGGNSQPYNNITYFTNEESLKSLIPTISDMMESVAIMNKLSAFSH